MGGINYISTILNMRTKGMAMNRLPLSTWGLLFTAIMGLLSFPVLLVRLHPPDASTGMRGRAFISRTSF